MGFYFKNIFFFIVVSVLDIHIRSEGCDDPGMTSGTCGIAYIWVNGKDYSPHGRGHNVVILDAKTGNAVRKHFFRSSSTDDGFEKLG